MQVRRAGCFGFAVACSSRRSSPAFAGQHPPELGDRYNNLLLLYALDAMIKDRQRIEVVVGGSPRGIWPSELPMPTKSPRANKLLRNSRMLGYGLFKSNISQSSEDERSFLFRRRYTYQQGELPLNTLFQSLGNLLAAGEFIMYFYRTTRAHLRATPGGVGMRKSGPSSPKIKNGAVIRRATGLVNVAPAGT